VHVPSAAAAITRAILERTADPLPKDRVSSDDRHGRATRKKSLCGKISARYFFGLLQRWRGYLLPPSYPGWRLWGSGKNPFLDWNSCPVTPSAPGRASGGFARRDLPDPVLAGSHGQTAPMMTGQAVCLAARRRYAIPCSALAFVLFRHFAPDSMAIVRIGLAIASADRPIQLKTKLPDFHAGARTVCQPALPRIAIAPQPPTASASDKTVAPFPHLGRASAVHGTTQRKHACRGNDRQSVKHGFLPWRGAANHLGPLWSSSIRAGRRFCTIAAAGSGSSCGTGFRGGARPTFGACSDARHAATCGTKRVPPCRSPRRMKRRSGAWSARRFDRAPGGRSARRGESPMRRARLLRLGKMRYRATLDAASRPATLSANVCSTKASSDVPESSRR
jgi:hypothetical protein